MFAKINRAAFLGLLIAGLGTFTLGAQAAPSSKGCCDSKTAACCQTKTRCCDKVGACCDTPGAACCTEKTNCCDTGRAKATAATCEVTGLKRAQCCASKASQTPPCCQKGCSTPGSVQR